LRPDTDFEAPVAALPSLAVGEIEQLLSGLRSEPRLVVEADFQGVTYAPAVLELLSWLRQNRIIVPFDWSSWAEGGERESEDLETAPVADVVRMLTVIVRRERFYQGSLTIELRSGRVQACLRGIVRHLKRR